MNKKDYDQNLAAEIVDYLIDWVRKQHLEDNDLNWLSENRPLEISFPWDLPREEWGLVCLHLYHASPKNRTGRPRANLRRVLQGIIWYLSMPKARWRDLPKEFPHHKTCHRYFQHWKENGVLYTVLDTLQIVPQKDF